MIKLRLSLTCIAIARLFQVNGQYSPMLDYGDLLPEEYDRPSDVVDADIKEMVSRMTLAEKIGQMTQLNQDLILGPDGQLNRTAVEYYANNYFVGSYLNNLSHNNTLYDHENYGRILEEIQEITLAANTTYKIPIIYGLDNIHGAQYVAKSTIFPHGINLGASFNPKLAYESAVVTARETRAANVHWTFAPVLDIPVNKQWARVYENFGEDPYLSSVMGVAAIRGYQGKYKTDRTKVAACMKHFIAYGAPWSGQDRDSSVVSDNMLFNYFVPSFQAAIDSGVATAMESYIDINGEPVISSKRYLQQLLRNEMKFKGMLVSDWSEVENLYKVHRTAATNKEAVRMAIGDTSLDMSMVPEDISFCEALKELVSEGVIPESRIDESAERLLQLKKDLGLLEKNGWKVDKELQKQVLQPNDIEVAVQAARESITLLKNDGILPLQPDRVKRVLVVGPSGNDLSHLAGGWTIFWQGATQDGWHGPADDTQFYSNGVTAFEGIKQASPEGTQVDYIQGFDIEGKQKDLDLIIKTAKDYDVIVACIGEHVYAEAPGNIHDMRLPQGQIEGIKAVSATGVPVVTVLIEGRPRVLETIPDNSNALLQGYLPGPWGGKAIGEILFGKVNPSGRLPYTYPKYAGDLKLNYWRQPNDEWDPLFEFGHGLSYSTFTYGNITAEHAGGDGSSVALTVEITNQGPFDGMETVILYIQQDYRLIAPPAKLVKGFQKINLAVGQSTKVTFHVDKDMLAYTGSDNVIGGTIAEGPVRALIGNQQFEFELKKKRNGSDQSQTQ